MHRFYCPEIAGSLTLTEDESRHAVRVLRLAEGDTIEVVDGRGTLYTCRIALAHPKRCAVDVLQAVAQLPHWGRQIVLAVAPTKMLDRMEWMVEKCVEMGVDRIVPLRCHNSERTELKAERLRKIAVAAMKQSLKATLPVIDEMTPLHHFLEQPLPEHKFIAYCDPELPREQRRLLARLCPATGDVLVLIGPEGDFSREEVQRCFEAGFTAVSLGESRLRTETAAVVACATVHAIGQLQEH